MHAMPMPIPKFAAGKLRFLGQTVGIAKKHNGNNYYQYFFKHFPPPFY
jgi:hypothetical protein